MRSCACGTSCLHCVVHSTDSASSSSAPIHGHQHQLPPPFSSFSFFFLHRVQAQKDGRSFWVTRQRKGEKSSRGSRSGSRRCCWASIVAATIHNRISYWIAFGAGSIAFKHGMLLQTQETVFSFSFDASGGLMNFNPFPSYRLLFFIMLQSS